MAQVKEWITMNGNHIPIFEGETKQQAIDNFIKNQQRAKADADAKDRQIAANQAYGAKKNLQEYFDSENKRVAELMSKRSGSITMKNGQILEHYTLKEMANDIVKDAKQHGTMYDDNSLSIKYEDGTEQHFHEGDDTKSIKLSGLRMHSVIWDNGNTIAYAGNGVDIVNYREKYADEYAKKGYEDDWRMEFASKEKQIAANKKQADERNGKMPEKFKDHAEEYIAGGIAVDRAFRKEDLDYIKNNLEETDKPLYRVEEGMYTAKQIADGKLDYDNFKFSGSYRSFSRDIDFIKGTIDEHSYDYADFEDPVVFEIVGKKRHFDMTPYDSAYAAYHGSQSESLVGGHFGVVDEDIMRINGKRIRLIKIEQRRL